jgi:ADP-ribose pyrophosphatase YjhB (NUDIX family)
MDERARLETSAGGIVFRATPRGVRYLLIRDSYRNWGFPKGHVENGEAAEQAALREIAEETGLTDLTIRGVMGAIEWMFRLRGQLIQKTCHLFLVETAERRTAPQRAEGITACRWAAYDDAQRLIGYANARGVMGRAHERVTTSRSAR